MIDSYRFGRIVIDGVQYASDVIIYPDRVDGSWWRREGHRLVLEDIKGVVEARPEVLIVGTGQAGFMKVSSQVKEQLKRAEIELLAVRTEEACRIYNRISPGRKVIAALHLTC